MTLQQRVQQLKVAWKILGITQKEIAKHVPLSRQTINATVNRKGDPRLSTASALIEATKAVYDTKNVDTLPPEMRRAAQLIIFGYVLDGSKRDKFGFRETLPTIKVARRAGMI